MHVHYLKHVPFEGLGSMQFYLKQAGHQITVTNLYLGEKLPDPGTLDLLIIMGGPMSVYDEEIFPWLKDEKMFIGRAIKQDIPVLGICLGAQLIACVLGAEVSKNKYREIGWHPIALEPAFGDTDIGKLMPSTLNAFHWHGDTFTIPEAAIPLGSSKACKNQGFLFNNKVLALQFHLEMTVETATRLICHCADELDNSLYVQTGDEMLADTGKFSDINQLMGDIVHKLLPD